MLDVTHRRCRMSYSASSISKSDTAESLRITGSLRESLSASEALTGIPAGTPIVAGAGDQAAARIGMGITRPAR